MRNIVDGQNDPCSSSPQCDCFIKHFRLAFIVIMLLGQETFYIKLTTDCLGSNLRSVPGKESYFQPRHLSNFTPRRSPATNIRLAPQLCIFGIMGQVLNFRIRVINNFFYFQQAMLLQQQSQMGGGLGDSDIFKSYPIV